MNAIFDLAVAFMPSAGYRGACTTVADVSRHGLNPFHLGTTPNKEAAVRLIAAAAMERMEGYGHGNRAWRRAKKLPLTAFRRVSRNLPELNG